MTVLQLYVMQLSSMTHSNASVFYRYSRAVCKLDALYSLAMGVAEIHVDIVVHKYIVDIVVPTMSTSVFY